MFLIQMAGIKSHFAAPPKPTNSPAAQLYNPGMETLYIDSLFILNLVINYLLLLISGRVCGLVLRRGRYFFAAVLGAGYAVGMYLPGLEFLALPGMKLCLWLIMALMAYAREENMLRCGVVFAAVSAAFGGFLWAIELAGGRPAFDMRTMLLSFALCYGLLRLIFGGKARLAEQKRVKLRLELSGRSTEFMALVDTGNQLRDPISGRAVLVASPAALSPLFPGFEALLEMEAVELMEKSEGLDELRGKFRLLPFSSLGGRGLVCAFRPDRAVSGERELEIMAAISKEAAGDGFQAII